MDEPAKYRERLAGLLGEIAVEEGLQPTRIDGVHVFKGLEVGAACPDGLPPAHHHRGAGPEAGLPRRRGLPYDPANYLVLAVPLPAECDAETEAGQAHPHGQHRRRRDDGRRDAPRNRRFVAPLGRDAARHLLDADDRGAGRGGHPAPRMPQVPGRQPPTRPPDGAGGRLSRAEGRARRGPLRAGEPRRPFHADCPRPEAHPFGLREAARRPRRWRSWRA